MKEAGKASGVVTILIVFGVLDAVSFVRTLPDAARLYQYLYDGGVHSHPLTVTLEILRIILSFSFAVSACAFMMRKRWAFPFYYCQFPLRIIFFSTSLSFLFLATRLFQSLPFHFTIAGIVALAELARLILTVVIHRRSNNDLNLIEKSAEFSKG